MTAAGSLTFTLPEMAVNIFCSPGCAVQRGIPLSLVMVQAVEALRQYCLLIKVGIDFMLLMGYSGAMIILACGIIQSFIAFAAMGHS